MENNQPRYVLCHFCRGNVLVEDTEHPLCPACGHDIREESAGGLARAKKNGDGEGVPWKRIAQVIFAALAVFAGWWFAVEYKKPVPAAHGVAPVEMVGEKAKQGVLPVEGRKEEEVKKAAASGASGIPDLGGRAGEDAADAAEVARLHRIVAVGAARMEGVRREFAEKMKESGTRDGLTTARMLENPASVEKAMRTIGDAAREHGSRADGIAEELRRSLRDAPVGEPARAVGAGFLAPLAAAEASTWRDVAAMLADAVALAPAFGMLSKRVSLRQGDGRVTFANPADNAAFKQRHEQLVTLVIRWDAISERLVQPAVVPAKPEMAEEEQDGVAGDGDGAP